MNLDFTRIGMGRPPTVRFNHSHWKGYGDSRVKARVHQPLIFGICWILGQAIAPQKPEPLPPINPDRPNFTNSPDVVIPGHVQLEIGYRYTREGDLKLHELGDGATLRIPTSKIFEWRLALGAYAVSNFAGAKMNGFEDLGIGFKLHLIDTPQKFRWSKPGVAFATNVTIPSGTGGFRENAVQPSGQFLFGWNIDDNNNFGASVGAGSLSQGGKRFTQTSLSAAYSHQLTKQLSGFIGGFTLLPEAPHGRNRTVGEAGFQYLLNNDTMLDFRVATAFVSDKPNYQIGAGISRRW